ncbi:MAG: RNA polymerase sigma factor [Lachnospiraceae bacterium]|nr:RNA polymerase sigma factor [Lachnospiraceae bacterium]
MEKTDYDRAVSLCLDAVYRTALSCCKNQQDAEDVVQTAFLKLLECDTPFQDEEHVRRWLIRVALNEAHSIWRSFWRRNVFSLEEQTAEPAFSEPENSELFYAVQKLPVRYREVVHLYYYEDYSIREIAALLNISETAIQTRLMRARKKLKTTLKEAWK